MKRIVDVAGLESIQTAARAVVYLTVEWSIPERPNRSLFDDLARSFPATRGISFFVLEEDAPFAKEWLAQFIPSKLQYLNGSGEVLWLAKGQLVQGAFAANLVDLAQVTDSLFPTDDLEHNERSHEIR